MIQCPPRVNPVVEEELDEPIFVAEESKTLTLRSVRRKFPEQQLYRDVEDARVRLLEALRLLPPQPWRHGRAKNLELVLNEVDLGGDFWLLDGPSDDNLRVLLQPLGHHDTGRLTGRGGEELAKAQA